jgi:hypothetical protein
VELETVKTICEILNYAAAFAGLALFVVLMGKADEALHSNNGTIN